MDLTVPLNIYAMAGEEVELVLVAGAHLGFSASGFKLAEGDSVCSIFPTFLKIPHENEIIWTERGMGRFKQTPRHPLDPRQWVGCTFWVVVFMGTPLFNSSQSPLAQL